MNKLKLRLFGNSNRNNQSSQPNDESSSATSSATSRENNGSNSSSVVSWFGSSNSTKFNDVNDPKEVSSFLNDSMSPFDILGLLKRSTELKADSFYIASLDTVITSLQRHNDIEYIRTLNTNGIANLLDMILSQRMASSMICEKSCHVICLLLSDETNRSKFSSSGFCYRLVKTCQLHVHESSLLLWGLQVIRLLTVDESLVSKFQISGVCELIANVFAQHRKNNEEIIEWSCRVIYNLCYDDAICSSKLSECGICEMLASLVRNKHIGLGASINPEVSEEGLDEVDLSPMPADWDTNVRKYQYAVLAIGSLCRRHDDNKERFGWLNVCGAIMEIADHFAVDDAALAESLVWTIGNLAFPCERNQIFLSELGACQLVVDIMNKHQASEKCVIESLRAIRNICHGCDSALRILQTTDAVPLIIAVLSKYSDSSSVVQWTWYCVATLAQSPFLRHVLGTLNISKLAGDLIYKYASDEDIVQWLALAVSELSVDIKLNHEFCREGLVMLLLEAMNQLVNCPEVVEECCVALSSLLQYPSLPTEPTPLDATDSIENSEAVRIQLKDSSKFHVKQQLVSGGNICELIMRLWSMYEKNELIIQESAKVIAILIYRNGNGPVGESNDQNLSRASSTDKSATNPVQTSWTSNDESVILDKLESLIAVTVSTKLAANNIAKLLPKILTRYLTNGRIVESCFMILSELLVSADPKLKFLSLFGNHSSFYSILANSIYHHLDVVRICELGCKIIAALSTDPQNIVKLAKSLTQTLIPLNTNNLPVGYIVPRTGSGAANEVMDVWTALSNQIVNEHLSFDPSSLIPSATNTNNSTTVPVSMSVDCGSVLIMMLLRHYCYYHDSSAMDDLVSTSSFTEPSAPLVEGTSECHSKSNTMDNDLIKGTGMMDSVDENETQMMSQSTQEAQPPSPHVPENPLALTVLTLISQLSSRHLQLQQRFAMMDSCIVLLLCVRHHRCHKRIVIAGCTLISNLTSPLSMLTSDQTVGTMSSSGASDLITYSQRLSDCYVCEVLSSLFPIYRPYQENMYFLCIAVDSICNIDSNRRKLCDRGVCQCVLSSLQDYLQGEGYVTQALSALGSLYDGILISSIGITGNSMLSRSVAQNQLLSARDMTILYTVCQHYIHHAIISQCMCRLLAYMVTGPHPILQSLFYDHGLVDMLITLLERFSDDSLDTVKFALLAIAQVSVQHELITQKIYRHDVCRSVIHILQKHYQIDFISEACCRCICSGLAKYSKDFGRLGACEIVLEALNVHSSSEAVLEWICRAIGVLAEDPSNVPTLCTYQAPERIVATLQHHLQYENSLFQLSKKVLFSRSNTGPGSGTGGHVEAIYGSGQTTILHTINNNSLGFGLGAMNMSAPGGSGLLNSVTSGLSRLNIFSSNGSQAQTRRVQSPEGGLGTDTGSVLWGVMAIYYMLQGSDCDPTYQKILLDRGICEIIFKLLLKYEEHEPIVLACCKAIVTLATGNDTIIQRLGAVGICNQIVEIMQIYPSSPKIARWGSRAVALLAMNNEANISRLASAGICETIPVAIQAHQTNSDVAMYGCEVIYRITLSDPAGSGLGARLGHSGACEAVVSVLGKHSSCVSVMEMASKALANLALVTGNASWFGPAGACDVLVNIVRIHEIEATLVANIWEAIGNLCSIDFNRVRLFNLNVGEILVKTLQLHTNHVKVAEFGGSLVGRLCEYRGSNNQLLNHYEEYPTYFLPNTGLFQVSGADEPTDPGQPAGIDSTTEVFAGDAAACLQSLSKILLVHPGNRQSLYDAGVFEPLLMMLRAHLSTSSRVCYNIVKALSILAHGKEGVRERFVLGQLGACELIIEVINRYKYEIGVCIVGTHAIRALCSDNYLSSDFVKWNQLSFSSTVPSVVAETVSSHSPLLGLNQDTAVEIIDLQESASPSITLEEHVTKLLQFISSIQSINQGRVRDCHGCQVIVDVLKLHLNYQNSVVTASNSSSSSSPLYKPSKHLDALLEAVAWAIAKLCEHKALNNRQIFGSQGVCELFVEILLNNQKQSLSFELVFYLSMALTQLSTHFIQNVNRLGFTLLGECLVVVCNKYFSSFGVNVEQKTINAPHASAIVSGPTTGTSVDSSINSSSMIVVEQGNEYDILMEHLLVLIANVCQDRVGQHRLGTAGLCKVVVQILAKYEKSPTYSSLVCLAIGGLGWQFPDNQSRLGVAGVCKGLANVLERHLASNSSASTSYFNYLGLTHSNVPKGDLLSTNSFRWASTGNFNSSSYKASNHAGQLSLPMLPIVNELVETSPHLSGDASPVVSVHEDGIADDSENPEGQALASKLMQSSSHDDLSSHTNNLTSTSTHSGNSFENETVPSTDRSRSVTDTGHSSTRYGGGSIPTLKRKGSVLGGHRRPSVTISQPSPQPSSPPPMSSMLSPTLQSSVYKSLNSTLTGNAWIRRPCLVIDGFAAVGIIVRSHELNRSKLQASSVIDILTAFLSMDNSQWNSTGNEECLFVAKLCAKDAMDAIISES